MKGGGGVRGESVREGAADIAEKYKPGEQERRKMERNGLR